MTLLRHEIKMNLKSLLIWTVCVGFTCFGCILLYHSIEENMSEMAGAFSQMGSFSTALGMDRISISTMEGYYATEIALIFAVGGAMFAAMTGAVILSKEEEGHTSEFLNTLPFGRGYIGLWKYVAVVLLILLFDAICICWCGLGFAGAGSTIPAKEFWLFHGAQLLMHLEVGSICFLISSISKRKQIGTALGLSVLLYVMDLMCRIIPNIECLKYITPYYFSNATDIFVESSVSGSMAGVSIGVTILCAMLAAGIYRRRDLAA